MVTGYKTAYVISTYHHWCCEFESRSGEVYWIQHYVIKFVSDLRQVGGFLRVLRFHPPIKLSYCYLLSLPANFQPYCDLLRAWKPLSNILICFQGKPVLQQHNIKCIQFVNNIRISQLTMSKGDNSLLFFFITITQISLISSSLFCT